MQIAQWYGSKRPWPIILPWRCAQSGDCCRAVGALLMHEQEREAVLTMVPLEQQAALIWTPYKTPGFVTLRGQPCPLLNADNSCSVYPMRPYQCRRWGCFRPDPKTEPLEVDFGFLGAKNTRERYAHSRGVRKQMKAMQTKGQKWARAHGWTGNER